MAEVTIGEWVAFVAGILAGIDICLLWRNFTLRRELRRR